MKIQVLLEIEVGDIPAEDQIFGGFVGENEVMKACDYEASEIVSVLETNGGDIWLDHFGGSDIFASFDRVTVLSSKKVG